MSWTEQENNDLLETDYAEKEEIDYTEQEYTEYLKEFLDLLPLEDR